MTILCTVYVKFNDELCTFLVKSHCKFKTSLFTTNDLCINCIRKKLFRMEEQDQAVKEIELIDFLPDICNMCTFQSCK